MRPQGRGYVTQRCGATLLRGPLEDSPGRRPRWILHRTRPDRHGAKALEVVHNEDARIQQFDKGPDI